MWRSNLAEDMEMDILLRLPVKSLLRFRCVSKSWCTRFQNPHFITNHYLKQTNNKNNNDYANFNVLALRRDRLINPRELNPNGIPFFSLLDHNTLSVKEHIYLPVPIISKFGARSFPNEPMLVACNGLICMWYHKQITLWNPATREFKHLPESHFQPPTNTIRSCVQVCGFGFDSKTNDYKVIRIFEHHIQNQYQFMNSNQIELYTLSTDSWREIQTPAEYLHYETPNFNTYINGVFHCVVGFSYEEQCILAFDMADEFFSFLPLPTLNHRYHGWDIGVFNRSLAVFEHTQLEIDTDTAQIMEEETCFDIWVMKEYGVTESWTKLLTIGPLFGSYCPIAIWKNDRLFLLSTSDDRQLFLYDPNTQEIEKLQVYYGSFKMTAVTYVESLVPINGRREHEDQRFVRLTAQMGDA